MQRIFRTKTQCSKPTVKVNITKVIAKHYFVQYLHCGSGLMAHSALLISKPGDAIVYDPNGGAPDMTSSYENDPEGFEFYRDEEIEEAKRTFKHRGNSHVLTSVSEFDFKHGYEKYHKDKGNSVERINLIVTKQEINNMIDKLIEPQYNEYSKPFGIYYCASKVAQFLKEYTKTYKKLDPITFLQDVPMSLRSEILKINQDCLK